MSSPPSPLEPAAGEGGAPPTPVEAERRWWWWIDRWLEPRWRALLTWVVLAVLMTLITQSERFMGSVAAGVAWVFEGLLGGVLFELLPRLIGSNAIVIGMVSTSVLASAWYQPLVLRVGLLRWSIWMCANLLITAAAFAAAPALLTGPEWVSGLFYGLPGLAILGRRTRPWMSLVAAGVATVIGYSWWVSGRSDPWLNACWWTIIYGAVMLYGTEPLARNGETMTIRTELPDTT